MEISHEGKKDMFELNQMEQLIMVAECGTLAGAAKKLHLSPVSYTHLDVYKRQQLFHGTGKLLLIHFSHTAAQLVHLLFQIEKEGIGAF